ncbi:MAG: DnaA/Hda family protein [bacterium]|nr:DnaA/Hda family protein [bacterium]
MSHKNNSQRVSDCISNDERKENSLNREIGHLNDEDGYNCELCNNRGNFYIVKGNDIRLRECKCMITRRVLRRLEKSGLRNLINKCTFANYTTENKWQEDILNKAKNVRNSGMWFFIGGQSGCGKTHLCTAICGDFLKNGEDVMYMVWVNEIKIIKNSVLDFEEHNRLMNKYRGASVLYIDDFFKNGRGVNGDVQPPTASDIQMAYDIINYRYNNNLVTIISSERTIDKIAEIDEAIAGRIAERCGFGENTVNIGKDGLKNYRLRYMQMI